MSARSLLLLVNPRAGRGRATAAAEHLRICLQKAGHSTTFVQLTRGVSPPVTQIAAHDCTIVIGGDGTLHSLLPVLRDAGRAVFHFAQGTENLFARTTGAFGENATEILLKGLEDCRTVPFDIGQVRVCAGKDAWEAFENKDLSQASTPRLFSLMLSTGPDASVVTRLAGVRKGAISHLSYVRHIAAECFKPYFPYVNIIGRSPDGGEYVHRNFRGMVVVANAPEYALRINPGRGASTHDGLLTLVLLPASSPLKLAAMLLHLKRGMNVPPAGDFNEVLLHLHHGEHEGSHFAQVDGDALLLPQGNITLQARVSGSINVLAVR